MLPRTSSNHTFRDGSRRSFKWTMIIVGWLLGGLLAMSQASADVGDPQIRTDHPWYPGELACSTFERLFATQAEQYRRATGIEPVDDEQRALASWFFRNTHYAHGEEGAENWWGTGFTRGVDMRSREYWTGLFSHGFGLCGTTHSQWTAEFEQLLGHGRGRGLGTAGHNSFEVWLKGGNYGAGRWALLDHDLSTVIFDASGTTLLGLAEVQRDWKRWTSRSHAPERQQGWLVCGLHPDDAGSYAQYNTAEYLAGYAGPPPMVHLRRGETFRRYFAPGLDDGRTFVFWGRNYNTGGIPGPERSHTWVNQPEAMRGSKSGAGYRPGQVRFANAVFTYRPDFSTQDYREGVIDEGPSHVTFEFVAPYVIAATPATNGPWGIYEPGARNGLVVQGVGGAAVRLSVDQGATWTDAGRLNGRLDLTDHAKGYRQYWLRFETGARELAASDLVITTVCQANSAILPRLKDGGTRVEFAASRRAVASAGPTLPQAQTRVVDGSMNSPAVTLRIGSPRGEPIRAVYAAAHVASGNPPSASLAAHIELRTADGSAQPLVTDWQIPRRGDEPKDLWSQSFCYGGAELLQADTKSIDVRFGNNGRRAILRAEAHAIYKTPSRDATRVTFDWTDNAGAHQASHVFRSGAPLEWTVPTGERTQTRWVEFAPVAAESAPRND